MHSTEKLPRTLDSSVVVLNLRLHSLLLVVVLDLSDLTLLGWSGGLLGLRLALSLLGGLLGLLGLLSVRRVAGDLGSLLGWGGDFYKSLALSLSRLVLPLIGVNTDLLLLL